MNHNHPHVYFVVGTITASMVLLSMMSSVSSADPGDTSYVHVTSGTGSFIGISPTDKRIVVNPGDTISGDVSMTILNDWASSAVVLLIGTTNWNQHSSSYWAVAYLSTGISSQISNVNVVAPTSVGTYFLIFGAGGEFNGAQIASCTNWAYGNPVWDDGNDIADFTSTQISDAKINGRATVNYLLETGYGLLNRPADAITVVVQQSQQQTVPAAPMSLTATPANAKVILSWAAPINDGGSPISNYRIYESSTTGNEIFAVEIGGNTSFEYTGLTNGITYYFKVAAKNLIGEGQLSNEANATAVSSATIPSPPINPSAHIEKRKIEITWNQPLSDGGSSILEYRIYRSDRPGTQYANINATVQTIYQDDSIGENHHYSYAISARNSQGESQKSLDISVIFPSKPLQPQNLAYRLSENFIIIMWAFTGNGSILLFHIWSDYGNGLYTEKDASGQELTFTDAIPVAKDVFGQHKIRYYIVAENEAGLSAPSSTLDVIVPVDIDWFAWATLGFIAIPAAAILIGSINKRKRKSELPPPPDE